MSLHTFDAQTLSSLYRRRELSPREVIHNILGRIDGLQERFNAYRVVDAEGALHQAAASEARWLRGTPLSELDGIPVALKDLLHVRGLPTRKGSLASPDHAQHKDAPVAARLREAGAVLLGKTQTAEFGWSSLTETALGGITRNPWNADHVCGGSSGGAAVAAALGLAPLQVGTDGGGSIRVPAAACGVFGFKPSYGRVAGWPAAHNGTLFHIGPLTRSVGDAALLLNAIAADDVRDWTSLPTERRDWRAGLGDGVRGLRIAYSPNLGFADVDPAIARIVEKAARHFEDLGAFVEDADSGLADPRHILDRLAAERAVRLRRDIDPERFELIDERIRAAVIRAEAYTLADVIDANDARADLAVRMRRFHERFDLLLTPVLSQPVPRLGTPIDSLLAAPFNLTQQPAASVPCGFDVHGLPVALQIIGPQHRDDLVLRAARAFESSQPFARLDV